MSQAKIIESRVFQSLSDSDVKCLNCEAMVRAGGGEQELEITDVQTDE